MGEIAMKWFAIRRNLTAWGYLAPNLVGFLIFTALPVLATFALSLFRWDLFHAPVFIGLDNFRNLLGFRYENGALTACDPEFWQYLGNTLFLMLIIPVNMLISLCIAMLLNHRIRGIGFFRTVFYLPTICGGVGIFLLWGFIFAPEIGLLNKLLAMIGIAGPEWLLEYHWAKPALMIISMWTAMGGVNMLLYLAGLQGIPPELYEAAKIDGASAFQRFTRITIPMLAPTNFFIFVTEIIYGFQGGFDSAFVLTKGGPAGATTTLSYYIYNHAFVFFNMGYAAAIALALFALVFLITIINWKFGGKKSAAF